MHITIDTEKFLSNRAELQVFFFSLPFPNNCLNTYKIVHDIERGTSYLSTSPCFSEEETSWQQFNATTYSSFPLQPLPTCCQGNQCLQMPIAGAWVHDFITVNILSPSLYTENALHTFIHTLQTHRLYNPATVFILRPFTLLFWCI